MKYFSFIIILFTFSFCKNKSVEADLIIYNAKIYTVDSAFSIQEAIAIKDGKIIDLGSSRDILNSYASKHTIDANQKFIYPGFIDAHCHFYGYGKGLMQVDLVGTNSFDDVINKTYRFYKEHFLNHEIGTKEVKERSTWLIGRGWDQNDWEKKEFPTKHKLDSLFPNTPVLLKRVDGHAILVNQVALDIAGLNPNKKIAGGELLIENGTLTGVLIDNAADSLEKFVPELNDEQIRRSLQLAEKNCLTYGLTTLDDAGLSKRVIDIIDQMQMNGDLKIKIYAMLTPDEINLKHYLKTGPYKTDRLNVRSFKFYTDGALGSRGACLCEAYHDKPDWYGFLLNPIAYFEKEAKEMSEHGFQMNTHCIGDSANRVILGIYNKYLSHGKDMRWRIEHAQVIQPRDFGFFSKNCLPSVQSTHATSDMYWARDRLGEERVKYAYAYKDLLKQAGVLPLGTDFPVEDINPFKTFYAAVFRKDSSGYPDGGFQMGNAISKEDALKGMTIWAAYANFEDKEKGSLEKGKMADLVILDTDLMKCSEKQVLKTRVIQTIINGELMSN